jgi:hypothetical protein
MIAQSTFFMDEEHGRARVFQQWGDGKCVRFIFIGNFAKKSYTWSFEIVH